MSFVLLRRAGSPLALLLAFGMLGLTTLLGGCAVQPGLNDTPSEYQTESDESEVRRRARTRLALATG